MMVPKIGIVNDKGPIFMTIGERLKEERQKTGLNQTELAEQCGVSKNTQLAYEKGDRSPDAAYLLRASLLGVDVLYVITGKRLPAELDALSQSELDVLGFMTSMDEADRAAYVRMGRAFSEAAAIRPTKK
ncbi:helix-turn-helix domain-containing protein [Pseudomonas aeruginosa]